MNFSHAVTITCFSRWLTAAGLGALWTHRLPWTMVLIHPLFADPVSYDRRHPVDSQLSEQTRARKWIEKKAKKVCEATLLAPLPSMVPMTAAPPRWRSRYFRTRTLR